MAQSEPIDLQIDFKPTAKVASVKPVKKGKSSKGPKISRPRRSHNEDIYNVLEKRAQEPAFDTKIEIEPRYKKAAASSFPPLPPIRGGIKHNSGFYRC